MQTQGIIKSFANLSAAMTEIRGIFTVGVDKSVVRYQENSEEDFIVSYPTGTAQCKCVRSDIVEVEKALVNLRQSNYVNKIIFVYCPELEELPFFTVNSRELHLLENESIYVIVGNKMIVNIDMMEFRIPEKRVIH